MKKPKGIKIIFLLAFLFTKSLFFALSVSQKDSLKLFLKKEPWVFKYGLNYLPDTKVSGKSFSNVVSHGYSNPTMRVYEQGPLEIFGPYLGFGRVRKESKFFSMYFGAYYTNTRASFFYGSSGDTRLDPVLPIYKVRVNNARGYLILNTIGLELNFHLDINKSRIIFSPFNPSFVFFNHVTTQKTSYEYDAIRSYHSGQSDSLISPKVIVDDDFDVKIPKTAFLGFSSPFFVGFEQRILLKKRVLLVGLKGAIVIKKQGDDFFGGQLYTGFEF